MEPKSALKSEILYWYNPCISQQTGHHRQTDRESIKQPWQQQKYELQESRSSAGVQSLVWTGVQTSLRFRGGQRIDFLSAGVCVGSQLGGKWKTVSALPNHSHFPITRYPTSLTKAAAPARFLFSTHECLNICVCVCASGPVFVRRAPSLLPGQTFPVCKHRRVEDTTASTHAET